MEVSMSIAEAALYGDLVRYLRDQWAGQASQFNETTVAEETARIDELIKEWFFAPQKELSGLTPRQIIRNEELDRPNVISHDHLEDVFDDDCPICQMMKDEAFGGDGNEWHFGLAPDRSLLDDYDPEGYEARWTEEDKKLAEWKKQRGIDPDDNDLDIPRQLRVEAREWLEANDSEHPFASNRFYDKQETLEFVNRLYDLGAVVVWLTSIYDEPSRILRDGGPYADTLIVELPDRDTEGRGKLYDIWHHELREEQKLDVTQYIEEGALIFWWD
jgi:hypothetical protein